MKEQKENAIAYSSDRRVEKVKISSQNLCHPWAFAQAVSCLEPSFLSSSLLHSFPRKPSLSSLIYWLHKALLAPCTSFVSFVTSVTLYLCDYLINDLENQLQKTCLGFPGVASGKQPACPMQ